MPERRPPSRRSDFAEFRTLQTRWQDNDIYGHMNNVVHYSLFDTAVNGWLIEQGLLDPHTSKSYGLVVETGCRYHTELAYPMRITAGMKVTRLGTSSIRYEIGLFGDDALEAAADGFFVHVYVDRATHRPVPLSTKSRAAHEALILPNVDAEGAGHGG